MILKNPKLFHYNVLKTYSNYLFSTLLYDNHIVSDTMQEVKVNNQDIIDKLETKAKKNIVIQGYFAKKNKKLYLILEKDIEKLPFRIKEDNLFEDSFENKVFNVIYKPVPFNMKPVKTMTFKELVEVFAPFEHTNQDDFTLFKITCFAAYCSRTFMRVCTGPGFGKDSIKGILQHLNDKVRVIDPRTPSAVLREITADGEIVINEVCGKKNEIKDLIQDIILALGAGAVTYTNGALKSILHETKDKYDTPKLSITAMYNNLDCYKDPKEFFDFQFKNNDAVSDRLFPIKLSGILTHNFENDLDCDALVNDNKEVFKELNKNIEYWKVNWQKELKPYSNPSHKIKGRHKATLDVLFGFINLYSDTQEEHTKLCKQLLARNNDYYEMLSKVQIYE